MYIRHVEKKNNNSEKKYSYYRLVHGYKIGNKVRQQTLLNLGTLEGIVQSKELLPTLNGQGCQKKKNPRVNTSCAIPGNFLQKKRYGGFITLPVKLNIVSDALKLI